jgi:hypothetical protein
MISGKYFDCSFCSKKRVTYIYIHLGCEGNKIEDAGEDAKDKVD